MERASFLSDFVERCRASGLDLAQPFGLASFHATNAPALHLDSFGRTDALAVVLGNTRRFWPHLLAALHAQPERLDAPHPLDDYVASSLAEVLAHVTHRYALHLAHRRDPAIAIQRIAHAAGLAELGPAHLCVHPEHGPWIALRAVVVFDVDAAEVGIEAAKEPFPASHCATCSAPCLPALQRAIETLEGPHDPHAWLAIRDACPVGRPSRYDADQIRYHYEKDAPLLKRLALTAG